MLGGPPWNLKDSSFDLKKELVDQGLHILAALSIFLAIHFVPWPWNAVIISLGIMVERERIQHETFPFHIGRGSLLDITVWSLATALAAILMRGL